MATTTAVGNAATVTPVAPETKKEEFSSWSNNLTMFVWRADDMEGVPSWCRYTEIKEDDGFFAKVTKAFFNAISMVLQIPASVIYNGYKYVTNCCKSEKTPSGDATPSNDATKNADADVEEA